MMRSLLLSLLTVVVLSLVLVACLPVLRRLSWRPIALMGAVQLYRHLLL